MHSLFHTADPPFTYFEPGTMGVLGFLAPFVAGEKPPIVTLDAGPNVHLFVPLDERAQWRARLAGATGCGKERWAEFRRTRKAMRTEIRRPTRRRSRPRREDRRRNRRRSESRDQAER